MLDRFYQWILPDKKLHIGKSQYQTWAITETGPYELAWLSLKTCDSLGLAGAILGTALGYD